MKGLKNNLDNSQNKIKIRLINQRLDQLLVKGKIKVSNNRWKITNKLTLKIDNMLNKRILEMRISKNHMVQMKIQDNIGKRKINKSKLFSL
jgi:hypothetical protein